MAWAIKVCSKQSVPTFGASNLRFCKVYFSSFCPEENIIQISYQKVKLSYILKGGKQIWLKMLNTFTYCQKTTFPFFPPFHFFFSFLFFTLLFFLPLLLLFVLNQVLCLKDQTTILLIHFEPNLSEHSLFAQHTGTFSLLKTTKYIFKHLYEGTY